MLTTMMFSIIFSTSIIFFIILLAFNVSKLRSSNNRTIKNISLANIGMFAVLVILSILLIAGILPSFVEVVASAANCCSYCDCAHLEQYPSVWSWIQLLCSVLFLIGSAVVWILDHRSKKK